MKRSSVGETSLAPANEQGIGNPKKGSRFLSKQNKTPAPALKKLLLYLMKFS
jgi:hypothetical protein